MANEQAKEIIARYFFGRPEELLAALADAGLEICSISEPTLGFGASDAACYKWPDDTPEHRACRAAYIEGADSAEALVGKARLVVDAANEWNKTHDGHASQIDAERKLRAALAALEE